VRARGLGVVIGELEPGSNNAITDVAAEAIVNALLAAQTMSGKDGATVHALEPEALLECCDATHGNDA